MRIHRNDVYNFLLKPLDTGPKWKRGLKLAASVLLGIISLGIPHAIAKGLHHRQVRKMERLDLSPLALSSHRAAAGVFNPQVRTPYDPSKFNVSPLHPETYLMEKPEKFSKRGQLEGFRAETVNKSDFTQANGAHTDDMTSYSTYPDGTCLIIATDGEGGCPASDSFSHFVNYRLHEHLDRARPEFTRLLKKGDEEGAQALAEKALSLAFAQAKEDHKEAIAEQGGDLDQDEIWNLYQGGTTVAAMMSIPDPKDPDNVWVVGVNVFDSPIVLLDRDEGTMDVEKTDSKESHNLKTDYSSYEDYRSANPSTPKFMVEKRSANTLMLVMTDGVTDNLSKDQLDEELVAVMSNPHFDSIPEENPPQDLSAETLKDLGNKKPTPSAELTPKIIRRRIQNFSMWRTRQAREHAEKFEALLPHMVTKKNLLRIRGDYDSFIYKGEGCLLQPREKLEEFLKQMKKLGLNTTALNPRPMDQEAIDAYESSHKEENPHRLIFEPGKEFYMIDQNAFVAFMQEHYHKVSHAFGGKPDGVSLIVAVAKS